MANYITSTSFIRDGFVVRQRSKMFSFLVALFSSGVLAFKVLKCDELCEQFVLKESRRLKMYPKASNCGKCMSLGLL